MSLKRLMLLIIGIFTLYTLLSGFSNANARSCNCVVFRMDDTQDNYHDKAQLAIYDDFISKNTSLTLGVIMHAIGNDSGVVDKVMEGYKKGVFELALHGWDHVDYSKLSEKSQQASLIKANGKMRDMFERPSQIFIPPYNTFNNSTLHAMEKIGLRIISADSEDKDFKDPGPWFLDTGFSFGHYNTDEYNIYHLPQTAEFNKFNGGDNLIKVPLNDIIQKVSDNISTYGYAVIVLHMQYFSSVQNEQQPETLYKQRMNDLDYIINHFISSKIKIVPMSKVVGLKPVALSKANNASAFANLQKNSAPSAKNVGNNGDKDNSSTNLMGSIATLQQGKIAWLLQGQWNMKLAEPLQANQPPSPQTYYIYHPRATMFNASFVMHTLNGSLSHTHTISDFKQTNSSLVISGNNKTLATFDGTVTITGMNGSISYSPFNHVPISLRISENKLLTISVDPQNTAYHFGDNPIYGTVYKKGQVLQSSQETTMMRKK